MLSEPKEVAVKRFEEATKNVKNYIEMKQMASHKIDELGIPRIFDAGTNSCDAAFWANPFTKLMDYYRGMKNALIDLRRCPDKVEKACDVIAEYNGKRLLSDTEEIKKSFEGNVVSLGMNILNAECFLSRQNFERFYLKYFRKQLILCLILTQAPNSTFTWRGICLKPATCIMICLRGRYLCSLIRTIRLSCIKK